VRVREEDLLIDPPWAACSEEAIGPVCAGPDRNGRLRIGGDLLVSRDAVARLEFELARMMGPSHDRDAVGRAVNEALAAPGVALEGVRRLESVRDVIFRALGA
jgi:hypothetical protein